MSARFFSAFPADRAPREHSSLERLLEALDELPGRERPCAWLEWTSADGDTYRVRVILPASGIQPSEARPDCGTSLPPLAHRQ